MKTSKRERSKGGAFPSHLIDARIAPPGDRGGATLARVRALIKQANPDVAEPTACFGDERRINR